MDLRAVNPGVWLVASAAMARAQEHPDPVAVEHAREMFVVLAKAAGISLACSEELTRKRTLM
jgi:hypothetical protein